MTVSCSSTSRHGWIPARVCSPNTTSSPCAWLSASCTILQQHMVVSAACNTATLVTRPHLSFSPSSCHTARFYSRNAEKQQDDGTSDDRAATASQPRVTSTATTSGRQRQKRHTHTRTLRRLSSAKQLSFHQ